MDCQDYRDDVLDVLYGEGDGATARRLEEHHRACAACREEMAALRRLRTRLAAWRLPERSGRRAGLRAWLPARGWAVAAGLLLALGGALGLSGSELRFEEGRVAFRLGRAPSQQDLRALLVEHEARHLKEIEGLRASFTTPAERDGEDLLRKVADRIRESEARQGGLLAARLAEFGGRVEAQRRYDLARISAGLSYLDGKTGQHVARTTELMGYVLEASQKR